MLFSISRSLYLLSFSFSIVSTSESYRMAISISREVSSSLPCSTISSRFAVRSPITGSSHIKLVPLICMSLSVIRSPHISVPCNHTCSHIVQWKQTSNLCIIIIILLVWVEVVQASLNVMVHAQKPDFVFRRNGRVHLNRRGRQFSRLLAAEVCASAVVMLDTPCPEVVWRVQATHFIRQFPPHFPYCASPFAITFQFESSNNSNVRLCITEASSLTL